MGNIINTIKRFLSNKNTVTILGVLLGLVVLYIGYNYRVNTAIETMHIPVAKKTITATTEITSEYVGTAEVLSSLVGSKKTIISSMARVINQAETYCVAIGTSIPEGAFFYEEQVVPCRTIQSNVLKNMPDGYKPVSLPVDIHTTYGNSMYPGDYIDLYARMTSDDGRLIYGQLLEKLPILDVRDSRGVSVFATSQILTPAELLFAVPDINIDDKYNLYMLLSQASLLTNRVELIPVPGNASYTSNPGETNVKSEFLMEEILKYTFPVTY